MGKYKVAISDCDHGAMEVEKNVFGEADIAWELFDCKTEDDVIRYCADVDGILSQYAPIKARAIEKLPRLKVLSRYGVGVDNLDIGSATRKGIAVCNVPDYCQDDVSTHAMALLLDLVRKVTRLSNDVTGEDGISSWPVLSRAPQAKPWACSAWAELPGSWPARPWALT